MGIFTWLGGDIGNANHWLSNGSVGTEPGPTDTANFSAGGTVSGAANVEIANFSGAYVFSGANLSAGEETVFSGGSIVQKDGINAIVSADTTLDVAGSYTLSGGTLSGLTSVELIAGPFAQAGGANTIGDLQISGATYKLSGGTLAVVSTFDGLEFVGLNNGSGGFIQSGGTHYQPHDQRRHRDRR